jgi:2'-5' RNA ligase
MIEHTSTLTMTVSPKRCFVAFPVTDAFQQRFLHYRRAHPDMSYLRWVPLRNMHITVLYLGDMAPERVAAVGDALGAVAVRYAPLLFILERIAYVPDRAPTMIWAHWQIGPVFALLVNDVVRAVRACGVTPADSWKGGYSGGIPHSTLARFKKGARPMSLVRLQHSSFARETMRQDTLQFVESVATPFGRRYETLGTYRLERAESRLRL